MRAPRKGKVLCVGRTYCDLLFTGVPNFPTAGEEVFSKGFAMHPGGGAYITAAYLAACGVETALCSVLPAGALGHEIMQEINKSSVNLSYCSFASDTESQQITVAISCSEDRSFLTNRRGPSLPPTITAALNDPGFIHLHIGEIATLADNPDLARRAKERGATVSLDCSWDETLLKAHTTLGLLDDVDIFLPNEKEIQALLGNQGPVLDSADKISQMAPWVVVKQGPKGATLFHGQAVHTKAAASSKLVDSTGAGDALNAGFISAWLKGCDLLECLSVGVSMGGRAIQAVGGTGGIGSSQITI